MGVAAAPPAKPAPAPVVGAPPFLGTPPYSPDAPHASPLDGARGPQQVRSSKAHVPLQRDLPGPHDSQVRLNDHQQRYIHRKLPR
ncbi:hypothetical protein N790_07200 [Arenimonas malthae CC-JY-1]|uniref:Uncharacterized protein n=2 Tax=Arenimonas TaxID=490567 RepID=A0A091BU45_9GAMM|nr:hypothetical protein N790_07200 [Arenimonas malthae CC-JY-1]